MRNASQEEEVAALLVETSRVEGRREVGVEDIPVVLTEEEADILSVAEAIGLAMFNIIKEEEEVKPSVKKEKAPKEESKPAKKEKTKEEEEKSVKKDAPKPAKTQVVEVSSDSESSEEESSEEESE
jgi:outer membrane biosynthesis protein TonB